MLSLESVRKGAIINGVINGIINAVITYLTLDKTSVSVLLTQDQISSTDHTVFGSAVPLAVTLAFILTAVAYFQIKDENKPKFFPTYLVKALKHSVYAFGLVTIFALLWQRVMGTVEVSHVTAAIVAGCVAGIVAAIVDFETKKTAIQ